MKAIYKSDRKNGIDFTIRKGKTLGMVGESGYGS